MDPALVDMFQKLNLEPGTYRWELPEYEIILTVRSRKPRENEPSAERPSESMAVDPPIIIDESCIMLDPWVELPTPKPVGTVMAHPAPPPPPDVPEIPAEDEGE